MPPLPAMAVAVPPGPAAALTDPVAPAGGDGAGGATESVVVFEEPT